MPSWHYIIFIEWCFSYELIWILVASVFRTSLQCRFWGWECNIVNILTSNLLSSWNVFWYLQCSLFCTFLSYARSSSAMIHCHMQLYWYMELFLHTFAKGFIAYIHCHIIKHLQLSLFDYCICLFLAWIMCIAWVNLSCSELHWWCCSDLECLVWPCDMVFWKESQKVDCCTYTGAPWRGELLAELIKM